MGVRVKEYGGNSQHAEKKLIRRSARARVLMTGFEPVNSVAAERTISGRDCRRECRNSVVEYWYGGHERETRNSLVFYEKKKILYL